MNVNDIIPIFWLIWFMLSPEFFLLIQIPYENIIKIVVTDISYILLALWAYNRFVKKK